MDVSEWHSPVIRILRRGPRPSIDADGFLMPLPCSKPSSKPSSRRASLSKIPANKPLNKAPPKKSFSVTDMFRVTRFVILSSTGLITAVIVGSIG